jgi:hypothetical protein
VGRKPTAEPEANGAGGKVLRLLEGRLVGRPCMGQGRLVGRPCMGQGRLAGRPCMGQGRLVGRPCMGQGRLAGRACMGQGSWPSQTAHSRSATAWSRPVTGRLAGGSAFDLFSLFRLAGGSAFDLARRTALRPRWVPSESAARLVRSRGAKTPTVPLRCPGGRLMTPAVGRRGPGPPCPSICIGVATGSPPARRFSGPTAHT